MSEKTEKALELKQKGYSCSQAAACVFSEALGLEEAVLYKASEGFGAGMGCQKGVCGALAGVCLAAGFQNSDGNTGEPGKTKGATTQMTKKILEEFESKNGAIICKDLKSGKDGKALRSCPGCIEDAVSLAEEILGL